MRPCEVNDRTGSIFHINVEKADCGATFKPIKNGIIFWNENINLSNYVDLFFQIDSKFTKTPNWQLKHLIIGNVTEKKKSVKIQLKYQRVHQ